MGDLPRFPQEQSSDAVLMSPVLLSGFVWGCDILLSPASFLCLEIFIFSYVCLCVCLSLHLCLCFSLSLCLNQPRLPFPFWIMRYNERKRRDPGVKGSEQLKRIDSFLGYVFLISHLQAPCETSTLRVTHFPQPSTQGYEVPRTRCGLGPCLLTDLDPTMCWSRGKSTEREDDAGKEIAVLLDSLHILAHIWKFLSPCLENTVHSLDTLGGGLCSSPGTWDFKKMVGLHGDSGGLSLFLLSLAG